jgi:hypothetical protein
MPKKYNLIPKPGLDQHRWCLCGCGIEVKGWNYRLNQPHRWVSIIHYMKTVKLKHSKETLLKKSQAMRKVWERKRREGTNKLSEEAKEHIRQSQIGKHKGELNGMYGKRHNPETIRKISASLVKIRAERKGKYSR